MTYALFGLPAAPEPDPGELGPGARRRRLIATRISRGEHPLGVLRLHPDAAIGSGLRCDTCRFRVKRSHHDKVYWKCEFPVRVGDHTTHPRATRSENSDIRAWWPACPDHHAVPRP